MQRNEIRSVIIIAIVVNSSGEKKKKNSAGRFHDYHTMNSVLDRADVIEIRGYAFRRVCVAIYM